MKRTILIALVMLIITTVTADEHEAETKQVEEITCHKKDRAENEKATYHPADTNKNCRVTCQEVKDYGMNTPIQKAVDPDLYALMRDGDKDGLVCE